MERDHPHRREHGCRLGPEDGDEAAGEKLCQALAAESDPERVFEVDRSRPGHRREDLPPAAEARSPELRQHHQRRPDGPRLEMSAGRSSGCLR